MSKPHARCAIVIVVEWDTNAVARARTPHHSADSLMKWTPTARTLGLHVPGVGWIGSLRLRRVFERSLGQFRQGSVFHERVELQRPIGAVALRSMLAATHPVRRHFLAVVCRVDARRSAG